MDAAGTGSRSGAGAGTNRPTNSSTRRGNARTPVPNKSNTRLQQNLARHLGGDTSQASRGPSAGRVSGNNTTLKVLGLKSSRAATNADGGVRSLIEFLEKKATNVKTTGSDRGRRVRPVAIKKVCQGIRSMGTGGYTGSTTVQSRFLAMVLAERADNRIRHRLFDLSHDPISPFKVF